MQKTRCHGTEMRHLPPAFQQALSKAGVKPKATRSRWNVDLSDEGKAKRKVDGITFHSVAEAEYYRRLLVLRANGDVTLIVRQVPFDIPGPAVHKVDFAVWYKPQFGTPIVEFVEVKGRDLSEGKLKRRQVEQAWNIHIRVLKAVYQRGVITGFEEVSK